MGYGFYFNHRDRACGYDVEATCDHPHCLSPINRGYDHLCGGPDRIRDAEGPGCGGYFCEAHMGYVGVRKDGEYVSLCDSCKADPRSLAFLKDEDDEGVTIPQYLHPNDAADLAKDEARRREDHRC